MRVALLSAVEFTDQGTLRAFLTIGGRSVIAWQVDLAVSLGCERIICLATGPRPELIELQKEVEGRGLQFRMVRGPLQLVGLMSADNEIVVIEDGLVMDVALASEIAGSSRSIAALPGDEGVSAGFERIDADRAWAGLLVARGNIVERLADMPADADAVSLLLRLALQSGTQVVLLDRQRMASGELILASDEASIAKREVALLDQAVTRSSWTAPAYAISSRFARWLAPRALKKGPIIAKALAVVTAGAGIACSVVDYTWVSLILAAVAIFSWQVGNALSDMDSRMRGAARSVKKIIITKALVDIVLIVILVLPASLPMLAGQIFLPLISIGLARLAERDAGKVLSGLASDRVLLALVLAPAASIGRLDEMLALVSLSFLAAALFVRRPSRITGD